MCFYTPVVKEYKIFYNEYMNYNIKNIINYVKTTDKNNVLIIQ